MDTVAYGGAACGIVIALNNLRQGQVSRQGAIILILLAASYFLPMRQLGSYLHIGMNGMKASDQIFAFLDLPKKMALTVSDLSFTWDFLTKNSGLDYQLTAGATNLSGGQKQRLTLAQALLKDSQVYIFDEATSNIDLESEAAIMAVLHKLAQKKTVILISHRLANVTKSDQIYFLEKGRLIEKGKHEE